MTFFSR
jgi:uncharacterized protein YjbJ (UPF0337 family)